MYINNITITKEFTFAAAHKLENYVGKCANLHGHEFKLLVTVSGEPDESGMILDFKNLKKIVEKNVIEKLDHTYINDMLFLAEGDEIFNPTAELLGNWIFNHLVKYLPRFLKLEEIKLYETPTSYVTITRTVPKKEYLLG